MNYNTTKGYFNSAAITFATLDAGESEKEFTLKAPEGKDQMELLVTMEAENPSMHCIVCHGVNGHQDKRIDLLDGSINIARIPTLGYVDENGYVKMLFVSGYGSVSSLNVGVGLINHIDAVNN